jgi:hypothetical protein
VCFVQNELKLAKEKVRRKTAIMSRQEEEITGKDRHLENLASQSRELSRLLELSREEASAAKVSPSFAAGRCKWREQQSQMGVTCGIKISG